jgi:hypothetical protein
MSQSQATYNPRFNFRIRRKPTVEKPVKSKAKRVALALILLLFAAAAWGFWLRGDPQLAKVMALRDQLEGATRDQRRELWGQMREEMSKLSPEARESLFADRRKEWEARERKRMNEFFAMSHEAQIASLDKDIDRFERRRKAWEERQAQGNGTPGAQGGPGGPGGRGWGGNSGDSLQRAKNYLNNTTPEDRAERGEHRRMMRERRQQRGLTRWSLRPTQLLCADDCQNALAADTLHVRCG